MEPTKDDMALDLELLRVLTAGDTARLEESLGRSSEVQTKDHVAVNMQAAAPATGEAAPPSSSPGTGCLLLGVTSNRNTALHLVASRGHAELAALVCEKAPSLVSARNGSLDTPLHCAARAGHYEVVKCLLSSMRAGGGAEAVWATNRVGDTALHDAVRHGRAEVVDLLMAETPNLASVTSEDGVSPLYLAASTHSLHMVRTLLQPSQDGTPSPASYSGPEGRTALHAAATTIPGIAREMAQEILNWEPEGPTLLTKVDSSGRTPLQYAILNGRLEVVKLFLDDYTSEQARIPDNHGLFPVHSAAMVGSSEIIDEVIKKCPDYLELVDVRGRNFLHCAVEHNVETMVRDICEKDTFAVLLNTVDYDGNTPLHLAVNKKLSCIVNLLVQTMAVDTGITNKDGLTALDLACRARLTRRGGGLYHPFDPLCLVHNCLCWSGARATTDFTYHLHVDNGTSDAEEDESSVQKEEEKEKEKKDGSSIQRKEGKKEADDEVLKNGTVGSVLIATVAFAAAFTVPGGFVSETNNPSAGTAILARRFAFRAFVLSDTLAFFYSVVATFFLIFGGARVVPRRRRLIYNCLAPAVLSGGALFMITAFAFGFQLVVGNDNGGLVVFVYVMCMVAAILSSDIWVSVDTDLMKAVWRRAGWRGLVNVPEHRHLGVPTELAAHVSQSLVVMHLFWPVKLSLIFATFVVAIVLNIALPNY